MVTCWAVLLWHGMPSLILPAHLVIAAGVEVAVRANREAVQARALVGALDGADQLQLVVPHLQRAVVAHCQQEQHGLSS